MNISVKHDKVAQEFSVQLEDDQAEMTYALPEDKVMDFQHTFVPENFRNQGVANQLIQTGLKYAQENNFKIIASCPAVAAYVQRHKEYEKLLKG